MRIYLLSFLAILALSAGNARASAQLETFSYQGYLDQHGQPFTGSVFMKFALFDSATVGNEVILANGGTVDVNGGTFTVPLHYPSAFRGQQLWLEITVGTDTLSPRQAVLATPVAQFALAGAHMLDYNETSPSSSGTPLLTFMTTAGPFSLYGSCQLNPNSSVTIGLLADSGNNYDMRIFLSSQLNDAGAITQAPLNVTSTTGQQGVFDTVIADSYKRIWGTIILHSRDTPVSVVSINFYGSIDARAASDGCIVQGTATLGL